MIAMAIPAAIRPYSMAVAPDSSFKKRETRFFIDKLHVYTWLVELTFGLAGVLSTVTMGRPYGATISAQLIRSRKNGGNRLFFSRVNVELRHSVKRNIALDLFIYRSRERVGRSRFMAP